MKVLVKIACAAIVLTAAPALANQLVALKPVTDAVGPVTLGDLFDGAGSASGIVVGPEVRDGATVVLDAGQVQRVAMQHGLTWNNENGIRRIIVHSGANSAPVATPASASAPDGKGVDVLTWARSLQAGEVVQPEDLTWTTVPVAPAGGPVDSDALIGKAAKRPLRSGAMASARDVTAPIVIHKDDMVAVSFNSGGVRLELQAKAKESAAIGDPVTVQNLSSSKVFQAVAAGPGRAVVGPEAEALRSRAISNPSSLALR